ncbi:hemagglutinin repeat-containing protein [Pseudomonas sp. KNUC1026]|uniref:hemagglutinin repeat-containing protein n=1 Tax=Pseudomonas sp. KNUC1026 TaxID=2893890 RepID=UPI001F38D967|nr:hemagglutinin repeat-containing protein [Pseudomonas sp. KNUC1026]UFH48606.1 hemagglutinin repeat-containing protein [Pseudomonas sp. KNUC1026]
MIAKAREAEAVRLDGVQAKANTIDLQAPNGGVLVDAATRTEHKDNLAITAGLGANTLKSGAKDTDASGLHARLKVKVDNLDSTTHTNASLKGDVVNLASAGDTQLNGATIDADKVTGQVDGDLLVATRQDRVKGTEVNVDGRISQEHNPQGLLNAVSAVAGPFAGKVGKNAAGIRKLDANTSPGISLDVVHTDRTTAAQQSVVSGREGVSLDVAGTTHLTGAVVEASQGQVALADGAVQQHDLSGRDYRSDVSINASNSPTELLSGVLNEATADKGNQAQQDQHVNAGFYRSGGHDTTQVLKAKIEQATR